MVRDRSVESEKIRSVRVGMFNYESILNILQ